MNKKLQVFVSSTYTDLIEERQAAVEAILDAGHIPAGMELFKAGNESQLQTIYKWIDESDVYMLILGGRYGSIESKSGKSYTQLEYEYALSKNILVFAVVLSDSFITQKITSLGLKNVIEQDYPDKYKTFKSLVMSKIISKVDDCKDIKINIHSTLKEFMNEYDLIGWVRNSNENDTLQLSKDNTALLKENNSLNKQIQKLQEQLASKSKDLLGNYTYNELVSLFKNKNFLLPLDLEEFDKLEKSEILKGHYRKTAINALDFFYFFFNMLSTGISNRDVDSEISRYVFYNIVPYYIGFNFLETVKLPDTDAQRVQTTKLGNDFYGMLLKYNNNEPPKES